MAPSSEYPTSVTDPNGFTSFMVSLDKHASRRNSGVSKKGPSKCYFIPVTEPLPGCKEPFQLPAGTTTCPVESCPRHGDVFSPDWRVNEHMKMRHAWPRKNTQPLTDKRVNGKSVKSKGKPPDTISLVSVPAPTPVRSSALKRIQPRPVLHAIQVPVRERKDFLSAVEKRNIEEWMAAQPDEDEGEEDNVATENAETANESIKEQPSTDVEMKDLEQQTVTAPNGGVTKLAPTVDEDLMEEARAYITWLDGQKPLHPSQNAVRSVLSQMVNRKLFRTGQTLPAPAQSSMLAVYRLLETRAADCAMEASTMSSPALSSASVSRSGYASPIASSPSGSKPKKLKLTFHGGEAKH